MAFASAGSCRRRQSAVFLQKKKQKKNMIGDFCEEVVSQSVFHEKRPLVLVLTAQSFCVKSLRSGSHHWCMLGGDL